MPAAALQATSVSEGKRSRDSSAIAVTSVMPRSCEHNSTTVTGARRVAKPPLKSPVPHVMAATSPNRTDATVVGIMARRVLRLSEHRCKEADDCGRAGQDDPQHIVTHQIEHALTLKTLRGAR